MFERKDKKKPTTLEEVKKAYEDLSEDDKKSFHQSIADRIHESIGEQEHEDGNKDSQSAADREHEALGMEHADGEGDVSEIGETDETGEKRAEEVKRAEEKKDEREMAEEAEKAEEAEESEEGTKEADNREDVMQMLTARVGALEEAIKGFDELKAKMEEYTRKQEESFGYKGRTAGAKKDMQDMSADELKRNILTGEI